MKSLIHATFAAAMIGPMSAHAGDVGITVSVGQPGFYGRIDIGNAPRPELIFANPVVIQQAPVGVVREPVYLHVPPGHEKHWDKNCRKYNVCGVPVYFVQDNWYNNVYVEHYGKHGKDKVKDHGNQGKHHGDKEHGDKDRRD